MPATASAPAKAQTRRAVSLTLYVAHVARRQQSNLSRQQAVDTSVEYRNEEFAAEVTFADKHSTL